jgi:hypothetical protein
VISFSGIAIVNSDVEADQKHVNESVDNITYSPGQDEDHTLSNIIIEYVNIVHGGMETWNVTKV